MASIRCFLAVQLALCWPLVTYAAAPTVLELPAAGKWNIDYRDGYCALLRQFGVGDDQITAQFTRLAPGDYFNFRLYGKMFRVEGPYQDVWLAFGDHPAPEPLKNRLSGKSGTLEFVDLGGLSLVGGPARFDQPNNPLTPEQEGAVTQLTIGPHRGKIYRIQLGSMRAPMAAMRTCTDDLVRSWGYDPEVIASLSRPATPVGSPGAWATSSDYPSELLRSGKLAAVEFRLDVDEVGATTKCTILRNAGETAFATMTCELLTRRAHFMPALDRDGRPTKSFFVNRVSWIIPR